MRPRSIIVQTRRIGHRHDPFECLDRRTNHRAVAALFISQGVELPYAEVIGKKDIPAGLPLRLAPHGAQERPVLGIGYYVGHPRQPDIHRRVDPRAVVVRTGITRSFDRLPFEIVQLPVGDAAHHGEQFPGPEITHLRRRQYPADDLCGSDGMAPFVGMIALGHQRADIAAFAGQCDKGRIVIRQSYPELRRQRTDLLRMPCQRGQRIEQVRRQIGGRRTQHDRNLLPQGPSDHLPPGSFGPFESDGAIVQRIVDHQHIGPVREHLPVETLFALFRVFPADARDDAVHHGVGIVAFDDLQHAVRIGVERPHVRRGEIARRHAVAVKHEIHGPIAGPAGIQLRTQRIEIVLRGSRLRLRRRSRECEKRSKKNRCK